MESWYNLSDVYLSYKQNEYAARDQYYANQNLITEDRETLCYYVE